MIIKKFSAASFRNIEKCEIEFSDGLNLLHGKNAEGKTSVIEGIYIFSRGKSFRAREDGELIKFGSDGFYTRIEYEGGSGEESLEYSLLFKTRQRKKNGYKLKGVSEMIGSFRSVLFYPDNLEIIKGGPEERRSFINVAISQCYPSYIKYYSDYKKALENRNCLLKLASKGNYYDINEISAWSESMAEYASYIYLIRREYIEKITPYAKKIMLEISSGKESVDIEYEADFTPISLDREYVKNEYKRILSESVDREIRAGVTLFGPHRDDIKIMINGTDSRLFASQGQQRSAVLSLKLSEGEVIREISGEYPVYLFDDVLSELDEGRRRYVLSSLGQRQIIITSCESDEYSGYMANVIEVAGGKYVSSHRK
ncbi:MAG: DNA replication/repair protein RecF [Clostridia bacterium]|nr:DNA replication/repair protein RecF [Clostridia bacterium]